MTNDELKVPMDRRTMEELAAYAEHQGTGLMWAVRDLLQAALAADKAWKAHLASGVKANGGARGARSSG